MMISMRYAHNLAQGFGLVWNPGAEPVEGFTNLLWTLYMALIHLLPIPLSITSLFIQLTGAICMAVTIYFIWRIAQQVNSRSLFVPLVSIIFTAFYFPLFNWTVILGTEVSLLTLLLTFVSYLAIHNLKSKKFSIQLFIILGLGTVVRMDFLIPALAISLCLFIIDRANRRKYLLIGIPIIGLFIISQTFFRLWYYHDMLPNTYYLKSTGYPLILRIFRGVYVELQAFNWVLISLPFFYLYFARNKYVAFLLISFVSVFIYSIYAGGDAWEYWGGANRYIAVAIPLFFISFAMTVYSIRHIVQQKFKPYLRKYSIAELIFIILCFLVFNTTNDNSLLVLSLAKKPLTVNENQNQVQIARNINSITKKNAKIAVVWSGIIPYFSNRYYIDVLGKSEKVIAREQAHFNNEQQGSLRSLVSFWPGHNKWDYKYVVSRYKPDIFGQAPFPDDQKKYLLKEYTLFRSKTENKYYILKGSKEINYDQLLSLE